MINIRKLEVELWESADLLRAGSKLTSNQYCMPVLGLIFLRYAYSRFKMVKAEILKNRPSRGGRVMPVEASDFVAKSALFLPKEAQYDYLLNLPDDIKSADLVNKDGQSMSSLGEVVNNAMALIEEQSEQLTGVLPKGYTDFSDDLLSELLRIFNNSALDEVGGDIIGRIYEYFLNKFAKNIASDDGVFFTPKSLVKIIVNIIEPKSGILLDPACGSGGMFVQSGDFINQSGMSANSAMTFYGQEKVEYNAQLCLMNMAVHGLTGVIKSGDEANSFYHDAHNLDGCCDYVMANPPFNQKQWRAENELVDDPRWNGYEVPPTSNANYGWILNIVSKLSQNGVAGFLLANGALSDDGTELKIRQQLIENHLVEAIIILPRNLFYTTDISVTLWVLNKNKKARVVEQNGKLKRYRNREDEILFMDLRQMGSPYEKKYIELTEEDRAKVTSVYHNWQQEGYEETYENVPEFCYSASFDEVKEKGFTLVPSRYIEFVNRDENIDFDTKMKSLQGELKELLVQEEKSKADLLAVFKELGYEIKL